MHGIDGYIYGWGRRGKGGSNSLRLLTGPIISVNVRWQIQSVVSHMQITESVPPEAKYLPLGDSSTDRHDEVWPFMVNSLVSAVGPSMLERS